MLFSVIYVIFPVSPFTIVTSIDGQYHPSSVHDMYVNNILKVFCELSCVYMPVLFWVTFVIIVNISLSKYMQLVWKLHGQNTFITYYYILQIINHFSLINLPFMALDIHTFLWTLALFMFYFIANGCSSIQSRDSTSIRI